jgi:hypothetical protein
MISKNYFLLPLILFATAARAEEPELAEAGSLNCPIVTDAQYSAIDRALPCVNFRLADENLRGSRFLREAMRQGVYGELVQRNEIESSCKANAYASKVNNTQELDASTEEIAARFVHYRSAFRSLRDASRRDTAATIEGNGDCRSEACWSMQAARGAQFSGREAERNRQRDQLIARIPYGFEPHVANAIKELDEQLPDNFPEGATQAQINLFRSKIREGFAETSRAYRASHEHFRSLWRATECVVQETPTRVRHISTPVETAGRTCPAGQTPAGGSYLQEDGTWRALSQSGAVTSLARELRDPSPRFQSIIQNSLACNADPYAQHQANLSSFAIATGALALVPGVGLLVVTGISAYVYSQEVIHSCFGGQATGFRVTNGTSCSRGMGLESAIHSADSTDCGRDVLTAVGAVAFSGAIGTTRRILSGAEGALGGATGAVVRNADNVVAASAGDAAVLADDATENVIVVTGTRPRPRGGRETPSPGGRRSRSAAADADAPMPAGRGAARDRTPAAGGGAADDVGETAGAAAARNGDEAAASAARRGDVSDASAAAHVESTTPSTRIVDRNIDNMDVRLNETELRQLSEETYARKREIDSIIGGRGNDIHEEHRILNEFLERNDIDGYIRARGLTGENARNLREQVQILQRERTVLTRARVNDDIAAARANGAEVRTVDCAPVNGLNSVTAFHAATRCHTIRFTRAVENYCSCGGRGALGAWAGPCAEAAGDYLTAGELADRDALPTDSARGLRECKRLRIPAGTVVVQGGLRPTMAGHGGAAQIYIPSRGLAPRRNASGGWDDARLESTESQRRALGISDSDVTAAPQVEVVAVAPVHSSPELREIFNAGRECRIANACTQTEIRAFTDAFNRFDRRNPGSLTLEERRQFTEWTDWLRNCRSISLRRGESSFSAYDRLRPGCRGN